MHSVLYYLYVFYGMLFYTSHGSASPPDQLSQAFADILMECLKEHHISAADLETLTNKEMPDNEASKCLFACAYKKTGTMDNDGKFSVDGVLEFTKKYYEPNDVTMKITQDFVNTCVRVNDVPVSDGTKGCERAALVFKCSLENALPNMDFL